MIEIWYSFVNWALPFDWAAPVFMKNALLAIILAVPLFGILGTMIVNNRMAFFSDAIGHSALAGIAIGAILGISNPVWSMLGFAVVFSIAIVVIKRSNRSSSDTIIGVFSSTAVAIGIFLLSHNSGFGRYSSFLIGDLLSISPAELLSLFIVFLIVIIYWVFGFNSLLALSVNSSLSKSRGVPTRIVENGFMILIALVVAFSIQWVGLLIINSLLVLPAASSRNFAKNIREYHLFSVLFAFISGVAGLILSFYFDTSTGATIVILNFVCYLASFGIRALRGIH